MQLCTAKIEQFTILHASKCSMLDVYDYYHPACCSASLWHVTAARRLTVFCGSRPDSFLIIVVVLLSSTLASLSEVPLGPYPDHLTREKCSELHAIYRDAVTVSRMRASQNREP